MRTRTLALLAAATMSASVAGATNLETVARTAPPADPVQRAELLAARQDWSGAVAAYLEAIEAHPKDAVLRNRLGVCYQRQGDDGKARDAYERAIDLKKDYAAAWNNLGTIEHTHGRYDKATSAYEKAIELDPQKATFYRNLGTAWLARKDVEKAIQALSEAVRLDPTVFSRGSAGISDSGASLAQEYFLYAKLLASAGELDSALEFLEKARAEGWDDFTKLEQDGDFAGLVADPRYAALK